MKAPFLAPRYRKGAFTYFAPIARQKAPWTCCPVRRFRRMILAQGENTLPDAAILDPGKDEIEEFEAEFDDELQALR